MRREQRESSYTSGMDDIEAIKRSFRESSVDKHESRSRSEDRVASLFSRGTADLITMERRYCRGKSEERYPQEFRGRSLSPERSREPRSLSVIPDRIASLTRALSPIRETTLSRSAVEETTKSSTEQTTQTTTSTAEAVKKAEEEYPYFIPRYFYPYYRPYYRLSPSELSAVLALARINARRYLTPRPLDYVYSRPYDYLRNRPRSASPEPKETYVSPPSSTYTKTDLYSSQSSYNQSMFRSFYTYPNLQYTRTFLPRHYYS